MLQPRIIDAAGIAHGFKIGTVRPKLGPALPNRNMSWCGTSLKEHVRLGGYYMSSPKAITCLACLSEGP